ncbi:MAG: SDR family NAD(P)-dependent oxidoreductase, partial [Firmicutes bacterium]|nr:SDR family NAD(P)-dependent oxidoreductase [Bacillota bacterium]
MEKHSILPFDPARTYLVTGAAGFIGFHLSQALLEGGAAVVGFDNLNDYYDVRLKQSRLAVLARYPQFRFVKGDLADAQAVNKLFADSKPDIVVNLAAQAGVRHSLSHPQAYIDSNIIGFFNLLEAVRNSDALCGKKTAHLLYASSSSVYGNQNKTPFATNDPVNHPISLYAATKVSNELMAYTYSHLYRIPTTGLRFFTVYGPYGRPDMAYFSFTRKMIAGEPIQIFNRGDMRRDFTYIDDIVGGMMNILCNPPASGEGFVPAKLYNIGNNSPVSLLNFIQTLEKCLMDEGLIAHPVRKEFLPMQPGDVYQTFADISDLIR